MYRLEQPIGQGGLGVVYLARCLERAGEPDCVVKALRVLEAPAEFKERFWREVQLTATLSQQSAHFPAIYDFGEEEGLGLYYVMEYVQGLSLRQRLQRGAPALSETLSIMEQLCDAMQLAHQAGIVHRDLKPENILLLPRLDTDFVKVIDLGLARALRPGRKEGITRGAIGTPVYMSPEQCRAQPIDARADLYALGVVFYELLTGSPPFPSPPGREVSAFELMVAHTEETPEPLLSRRPTLWYLAPFESVIQKALRKRPESRYQSAKDFWSAILPLVPLASGETEQSFSLSSQENISAEEISILSKDQPTQEEPHNLPPLIPQLIGREKELAALREAFRSARLVTLVGPGGIGKTALALSYAEEMLPKLKENGGVWFCDLSSLNTREELCTAVAQALSVPLLTSKTLEETEALIASSLAGRGVLLFLFDNFEQLAPHVSLLSSWLQKAPEARFLVTSRQRLEATGSEVSLAPLSSLDGERLLVERASFYRQQPLSPEEEALARSLVVKVEGVPLAIELIASRASSQSLLDISSQLTRHLEGPSALHTRSSVRGSLDWSWSLLTPSEQELFVQCAIFREPFSFQAAEAVLLPTQREELQTLLQSLLHKSLLRVTSVKALEPEERLGMLESVREYARERLEDSPRRSELLARHQAFFLTEGEALSVGLDSAESFACLRALSLLLGELRSIFYRSLGQDPSVNVRAALVLDSFFSRQGPQSQHQAILDAAVNEAVTPPEGSSASTEALGSNDLPAQQSRQAAPGIELQLRSKLFLVRAEARLSWSNPGLAAPDVTAALATARAIQNKTLEARALLARGKLARALGKNSEAEADYQSALSTARSARNRWMEANALGRLGLLRQLQGAIPEAEGYFQRALRLCRDVGNTSQEGIVWGNLGTLRWEQGKSEEAEGCFQRALSIQKRLGNRRSQAVNLSNLGMLRFDIGSLTEADVFWQKSLRLSRLVGDQRSCGIVLCNLASLLQEQQNPTEADALLQEALSIFQGIQNYRLEAISKESLGVLSQELGSFASAEEHLLRALALIRPLKDPRTEGSILANLAVAKASLGEMLEAEALFTEAKQKLASVQDTMLAFEVQEGHLWAARAKEALRRGDLPSVQKNLEEAYHRLDLAVARDETTGKTPSERSSSVRLAARILSKVLHSSNTI